MSKMIKQLIPQPPVDEKDIIRWSESITEILNNILEAQEKSPLLGNVDHGDLDGLSDDDHTQYLKEKGSSGAASDIPVHTHASAGEAGTVDHGALTGKGDDDHTIYLKEKGSGGLASEIPLHTHATDAEGGILGTGFLAKITASDAAARYTVTEQEITSSSTDTLTYGNLAGGRVVTATNLGELISSTVYLPTDGTVKVVVFELLDAGPVARYVFTGPPIVVT